MSKRGVYEDRRVLASGKRIFYAFDDDGLILDVQVVEKWEDDCHAVAALAELIYPDGVPRPALTLVK